MTVTEPLQASALTSDRIHLPAASFSRVTGKTREKAAERGEAMDDGSFPIRDQADLKRAIKAFGRAKDKPKAKRHIIKRAKALEKVDLLPEAWRETANKEFAPKQQGDPVEIKLREKAEAHNALAADGSGVTVGKLRCVYNRGLQAGAKVGFSAEDCAMARVNSFLVLLRSEKALTASVHPDADLLPIGHPTLG